MKKLTKLLLSLACVTAVFAAQAGVSANANQAMASAPMDLHRIYGTITKSGNNLFMQRDDSNGGDIVLNISDKTKILDAVNGMPVAWEDVQEGSAYAYIGPAVAMSMPPIGQAEIVFCNIPAGFKVPEYITVSELKVNSDGVSGTIKGTNGTTYTVPADSQILPYLTRNIERLPGLTKGRNLIIWTQADSVTAYKIVAFQGTGSDQQNPNGPGSFGWTQKDNSWYFYNENGGLLKGWLNDNGTWYYLSPDNGVMQTGFITIDGKTYFLQEDGSMLTEARTFTPDENGALH